MPLRRWSCYSLQAPMRCAVNDPDLNAETHTDNEMSQTPFPPGPLSTETIESGEGIFHLVLAPEQRQKDRKDDSEITQRRQGAGSPLLGVNQAKRLERPLVANASATLTAGRHYNNLTVICIYEYFVALIIPVTSYIHYIYM